MNNIPNPNLIYIGQILKVPHITNNECISYTIKYGDTLTSIARRYNTTIKKLAQINDIQNVNIIYAGDTIKIC